MIYTMNDGFRHNAAEGKKPNMIKRYLKHFGTILGSLVRHHISTPWIQYATPTTGIDAKYTILLTIQVAYRHTYLTPSSKQCSTTHRLVEAIDHINLLSKVPQSLSKKQCKIMHHT